MYTPQPYNEAYLPEQDGHRVYYAQFGNPDGPAVLNCHSGPGGSGKPKYAANFDLERYRVINFDQRGCGQSEPAGKLENNSTTDLVADMERIRTELGLERWFVSGSSWGSTVALAYAEAHPERVQGLLLSALFLGDKRGDDWAFRAEHGAAQLFPDARQQLADNLAEFGLKLTDDVPQELLTRICSDDTAMQQQVAAVVASWEVNLLSRNIAMQYTRPEEVSEADITAARIFLHYQADQFWLAPDELLSNAHRIATIPAVLVHGRYDILCPYQAAWDLAAQLSEAELIALPESHHAIAGDGAVARSLAFDRFLYRHTKTS